MFEVLSRWEATALMHTLASGYETSKQLARELNGWRLATPDSGMRNSYNTDLNEQALIRSENTALRWQIKREALDTDARGACDPGRAHALQAKAIGNSWMRD